MGSLRCTRCGVRMLSARRIHCPRGPCPMEPQPNWALWVTVAIASAALVLLMVVL